MAYLPASRAVNSVGIDPMFRGRIAGVGGILNDIQIVSGNTGVVGTKIISDDLMSAMFKSTGGGTVEKKVLTPEEIAQMEAVAAKQRAESAAEEKRIQDIIAAAKRWQTTSPIATVKVVRTDGAVVSLDIYGYDKESGRVWVKDPISGQIGLAHESMFKDSPEWQAAKSSIGKSSALPLLLGAAFLLLS